MLYVMMNSLSLCVCVFFFPQGGMPIIYKLIFMVLIMNYVGNASFILIAIFAGFFVKIECLW